MSNFQNWSVRQHVEEAHRLLDLSKYDGTPTAKAGVLATQALVHLRLVDLVAPRKSIYGSDPSVLVGPLDFTGPREASR